MAEFLNYAWPYYLAVIAGLALVFAFDVARDHAGAYLALHYPNRKHFHLGDLDVKRAAEEPVLEIVK